MTTTVLGVTDEQHLTVVKHLANGKTLEAVAMLTKLDRSVVLDIGSKHGYPDTEKLGWAVDILAKNLNEKATALPPGTKIPAGAASTPAPAASQRPRPSTTSPSSVTEPDARPVGRPDEIRVLLNTGKSHTSKRIQAQANRVIDAIGKLKDLIAEDEEKHSERRRIEQEREAQRAEVKRLEKQLADAKAKLRGTKTTAVTKATKTKDPDADYPCRNTGCDKHYDTPQGRSLHERMKCEHREQEPAA